MKNSTKLALAAAAIAAIAACATMPPGPTDAEARAKAAAMMKASFKERGQAKLDRLDQDDTQALCSQYAGKELPKDVAATIEKAKLAAIRYPADGKYLGDWRAGERIAQRGTGSSIPTIPPCPPARTATRATSCSKQEIATAPSARRSTTSASCAATPTRCSKYAYGKVYNSEALHGVLATCRASATAAS